MIRLLLSALLFSVCCTPALAQVEWNDMPLPDGIFFDGTAPFKRGDYTIKVPAGVGLEFKIAMNAGDIAVYS